MDSEKSNSKNTFKYWPSVLLALILIVTLVLYQKFSASSKNQEQVIKNEIIQVVDQVSKLMVLPKNEPVTLIRVTDPSKLQNQAFFRNAQAGDKLLLYPASQQAVLYSPALNKIVQVAVLNLVTTPAPDSVTLPKKK